MLYQPHDYQKYATNFIVEHPIAAVLLQMGLGKSVITLTAIAELALERFEVCRVLVIAPLRVARDTWPAEDSEVGSPEGPDVFGRGGNGSRAPVSASEGHADPHHQPGKRAVAD